MFSAYVPYLRGGSEDSKFSQFQIFPKLGTRGEGHRISNFSQIQKSPKHPGGGEDQENCGFFPLFVTFFDWEASLRKYMILWTLSGSKIHIGQKTIFFISDFCVFAESYRSNPQVV